MPAPSYRISHDRYITCVAALQDRHWGAESCLIHWYCEVGAVILRSRLPQLLEVGSVLSHLVDVLLQRRMG